MKSQSHRHAHIAQYSTYTHILTQHTHTHTHNQTCDTVCAPLHSRNGLQSSARVLYSATHTHTDTVIHTHTPHLPSRRSHSDATSRTCSHIMYIIYVLFKCPCTIARRRRACVCVCVFTVELLTESARVCVLLVTLWAHRGTECERKSRLSLKRDSAPSTRPYAITVRACT